MDMDNRVGIDCGSRGVDGAGENNSGGRIGATVIEQQEKKRKKKGRLFHGSCFLQVAI